MSSSLPTARTPLARTPPCQRPPSLPKASLRPPHPPHPPTPASGTWVGLCLGECRRLRVRNPGHTGNVFPRQGQGCYDFCAPSKLGSGREHYRDCGTGSLLPS
eukprot:2665607-Rhodomonas_salina.2